MSRHLEFSPAVCTGKTKLIIVLSKLHKTELGRIKWLGRWRQYAFFPEPGTAFNPECMKDISTEIERLQKEWRTYRKVLKETVKASNTLRRTLRRK